MGFGVEEMERKARPTPRRRDVFLTPAPCIEFESPLIGISKLSRWFYLGRFARSDTLAAS